MKRLFLILVMSICGCDSDGALALGSSSLAGARALCNESSLTNTGRPMTEAEWDNLVATHEETRDMGLSRNNAFTLGNLTCGNPLNEVCFRCNEALVDALWP